MKKESNVRKIVTFEEGLKKSMGKKYEKLSKEDRRVIREMSKCQDVGYGIGTAISSDERK